jgi:2-isopropylmalate synthase
MTPGERGAGPEAHLVLGKHSGRHALRMRLEEIGFELQDEEDLERIFQRFKRYADARKEVTEAELEAIAADEVHQADDLYVLHGVHVSCGVPSIPTASVSITRPDGEYETLAATGTGPVDAIFTAINRICRLDVELREYVVHAVSGGVDTLGEVTVRIRSQDESPRTFSGHGADADIMVASAKAYLSALNKLARAALRRAETVANPEAVAQS